MNEYNEKYGEKKEMDIEYYDRLFSDHFFSQKINAQGMVLEFMDHYYHGIMTGFFRQYLRRK